MWESLSGKKFSSVKESETYFGKKHEQLVTEKLQSMGYKVIRMSQNFPYDLLVNNSIKIDYFNAYDRRIDIVFI